METLTIELNPSQYDVLTLPNKYKAYVGGYGSGKSFVGAIYLISHHLEFPGTTTGFYAPTYRMVADIFFSAIEEVAELHGLTVDVNSSDPHVDLYEGEVGAGAFLGRIMCRSLSQPAKIIGYQTSLACADEVDTIPKDQMEAAWQKIIARQRLKIAGENGVLVTTTPEGFNWVYHKFYKTDNPDYGLIQVATMENEANLPADYTSTLRDSYDEQRIQSYLLGQFTNLTSGSVYHQFNRQLNNAPGVKPEPSEPLHVGLDMNVTNMSATVHVVRFGKDLHWSPTAPKNLAHERAVLVAELTKVYDTPAMIDAIKREFPRHHITVYPDASGKQRHSADAAITDIRLLHHAGFTVEAPKLNPMIRDRVNNVNAMICNSKGVRRYFVNVEACPESTEALENQSYDEKTGQPDKESGYDHLNDSIGYMISRRYGIARPVATVTSFR